ncbi:MAG: DHH family phosphoesterase [Candidatus Cloacimonetes bacterium]|nr:DHH family phosphoesterase [Candidatus Cloacimonadota bacterium]
MHFHWETSEPSGDTPFDNILRTKEYQSYVHLSDLKLLPPETGFKDIGKAVKRIFEAIRANEKIVIFGHDDPDGITSTYILYNYLKSLGIPEITYYIPNRMKENHGIQNSFVRFVRKGGFKLIITVDNGITSFEGIRGLRDMGCDVILTDHHILKPEGAPHCEAVINPKQKECKYPFDMLAGVGVTLMLIRQIFRYCKSNKIIASEPGLDFYFWTAVGSISDKVPLISVNRIIVKHVIDNFEKLNYPHINALKSTFGQIDTVNNKLEFLIFAGKIIMNGRDVNGNHLAMDFLLSADDEVEQYLQELIEQKEDNEKAALEVIDFVESIIKDYEGEGFIYFDDENRIPYPMLGMAASHTSSKLKIPALFLSRQNDVIVCEGRCGSGFSILEAFSYCSDSLIQFGGHVKAAGFTMEPQKINEFIFQFNSFLQITQDSIVENKVLKIDTKITIEELTDEFWHKLQTLQPFGMGNPEPIMQMTTTRKEIAKRGFKTTGSDLPENELEIAFRWIKKDILEIVDYN